MCPGENLNCFKYFFFFATKTGGKSRKWDGVFRIHTALVMFQNVQAVNQKEVHRLIRLGSNALYFPFRWYTGNASWLNSYKWLALICSAHSTFSMPDLFALASSPRLSHGGLYSLPLVLPNQLFFCFVSHLNLEKPRCATQPSAIHPRQLRRILRLFFQPRFLVSYIFFHERGLFETRLYLHQIGGFGK